MYIVIYKGPFGFIKPWTAVRDGETFSQQFLTGVCQNSHPLLKYHKARTFTSSGFAIP